MSPVILGPCPCQGCGKTVYWGRRVVPRTDLLTGAPAWRDTSDGMPHVCFGRKA